MSARTGGDAPAAAEGAPRTRRLGRLVPAPLRDGAQRWPLLGWLGVGLAVRVALMPFTVTADLLAVYWRSHLIAYEGQLFGSYLVNMGAHYVHAASLRVFGFLLPPPDEIWTDPWWWSASGALAPQVQREFSAHEAVHQTLFALKLPYLIADIAAGLLLLALLAGTAAAVRRRATATVGGSASASWWLGGPLAGRWGSPARALAEAAPAADARMLRRAWAFWMLSPIGIYASYAFGRYEALAVVFVVGALLCAERGRPWWAAVLLGLAVTMRTYPLLLIPVFALVVFRRPLRQAAWSAAALAPFAVVMASNRLLAGTVGEVARLQDFHTGTTFFAFTLPVSADGQLYVFFLVVFVLLGVLLGRSWGWWGSAPPLSELWIWLLLIHAAVFGAATFGGHYFMWFTPFVALAVARRPSWRGVLPLHLVQVVLVLVLVDVLAGPGTGFGLLEPVQPDLATSLPSLRESFLTDLEQRARVLGLVRTAFTVTMALLVAPAVAELAGRGRSAVGAQASGEEPRVAASR